MYTYSEFCTYKSVLWYVPHVDCSLVVFGSVFFFFQKRSASSFVKYKCVFALIFVRLKFKSSVKCNVRK